MKTNQKYLTLALIFMLSLGLVVTPVLAQGNPDRPILYVESYTTDQGLNIDPWGTFTFTFNLKNNGKNPAVGVMVAFSSNDFSPMQAGGVAVISENDIASADTVQVAHQFKVSDDSTWKYNGILQAAVTYIDSVDKTVYNETFTFTLGINQQPVGPTRTPTVAAAAQRPLIVVSKVETDINPLQPGSTFRLKLTLNNLGPADARSVSLVYGGGASVAVNEQGTPQPGTTGGSSELTNFAPIGSSNVILIGDIASMATTTVENEFIVNVSTVPGAYPLKLSFVFTDPKGGRYVDDAVITLLVFALPQLEVVFYRDPGIVNVGMTTALPIQITNIARKQVILGNATVRSKSGDLTENTALVGMLDPGGYFTMDVMYTPFEEGTLPLDIEIRYTDDFNQLRTYNTQLELMVVATEPMPDLIPLIGPDGNPVMGPDGNPIMIDPNDPTMGGIDQPIPSAEKGFFAKIWDAIKSFFGFGSKIETPLNETPSDVVPQPDKEQPIPMPLPKGDETLYKVRKA
jgi:hypothetical protein